MPTTTSIRILANENNRRGDLFGRLIADLFVALGYEQPRLNVHKSGRELDLVTDHRLEPRRAIGECKATASPIGGDDLNKLLGVRERERGDGTPIVAYFVSLAGFTETAIEQEKKTVNPILLLKAADVVRELVDGRILISRERAAEVAGQSRASHAGLTLDPDAELLAHERGWIWAVYYTEGRARTHVVLIHSDGTPLARALADEVIAADRDCGGALHTLTSLNPEPAREAGDAAALEAARAAWCEYLTNECGYIHLDGLPADAEVGSKRLALENLFVPLHLDVPAADKSTERKPLGVVLGVNRRLAMLGAPGAGKSTLLKRLAVAYADSTRRSQVDDGLPARKWLPLFVRCRELRGLARGSFADLVQALSQREGVRQFAEAFLQLVDASLLEGRVLLLVDGLDEISDPGDRAAFVATLRATLLAYPKVAIVVTSREAGFRHVASHLASICLQTSLSPFDDEDVKRLTVAWHREVVGDSEKVRADAESLAASIRANDRIKQLAVNPLLLTTLLLVKRWVGSLPTKRAVLYGKAVEVLLMTWNVEGHKPIPTEEALPQLCYVASTMMLEGIQKISRPRLVSAIKAARKELDTELGYATGSVAEFIQRVEERSSLLMMTGHDVENGELVEFFEFRHLTFQEYLTAKAMVEGWHPGRNEDDTLSTVLCKHFDEQRWREVIPLAAAIGGKATDALIAALTTHVDKAVERSVEPGEYRGGIERKTFSFWRPPAPTALLSCLADDVAARPSTIRAALQALVERGEISLNVPRSLELNRSRYAAELADVAGAAFLSRDLDFTGPGEALAVVLVTQKNYKGYADLTLDMLETLKSSDPMMRCGAAIVLGKYSWHLPVADVPLAAALDDAISAIASMIESHSAPEVYAAIEAAGALGRRDHATMASLTSALFRIWMQQQPLSEAAGRALIRPAIHKREPGWAEAFPTDVVQSLLHDFDGLPDKAQAVALVAAWYSRIEADDALQDRCRRVPEASAAGRVAQDLLEWLSGPQAEFRLPRARARLDDGDLRRPIG